jgi:hypothetical protein
MRVYQFIHRPCHVRVSLLAVDNHVLCRLHRRCDQLESRPITADSPCDEWPAAVQPHHEIDLKSEAPMDCPCASQNLETEADGVTFICLAPHQRHSEHRHAVHQRQPHRRLCRGWHFFTFICLAPTPPTSWVR